MEIRRRLQQLDEELSDLEERAAVLERRRRELRAEKRSLEEVLDAESVAEEDVDYAAESFPWTHDLQLMLRK
eukprot:9075287-Prorocentrum_lima.AAC.1